MAKESWNIDVTRSSVGFTVRHLMVSKVRGSFTRWRGSLAFDESSPAASSAEATIEVASVDTRDAERDQFLRTDELLEPVKFPEMTWRTTSVTGGGTRFKVTGDLTLRGVTRPVVLDVRYAGRMQRAAGVESIAFSAEASVHRKDFGAAFSPVLETGGVAVADKVDIQIEVVATRAS